jgi:hypothetical protein
LNVSDNGAIDTGMMLRLAFHLALRQTEGPMASIFGLLDVPLSTRWLAHCTWWTVASGLCRQPVATRLPLSTDKRWTARQFPHFTSLFLPAR